MRHTLLLALLLATPALASAPSSAAGQAVRADPCDGASGLRQDPACGDGPLCAARERVQLACALRDAVEKRYVFLPVKQRLLGGEKGGFEPHRHLDACVAAERAIVREDDPLRFYDRMRRCTAAFEDGHLVLGTPVRLPQVALGIGLRLVGGRVVIANRERKLVSYLDAVSGVHGLDALLAVGNEVAEIDGHPVQDVLADLARHLPASSAAARRERAVDALTRRDFRFPEKRTALVTVVAGGERRNVELPWWISPDAEAHVMTRDYLRRVGLVTTDLLAWRYDQARDTWDRDRDAGASQGYLRAETVLPPADAAALREYTDDQDRPAVRLGEVVRRRDRAFCYLQILTFHTETLGAKDGRQPFPAVLEGFVSSCRAKGLDLVLDLRQNEGGFISHSSALLSMLAPAGKNFPGGALVLRATTQNQLVFQQRAPAIGGVPARSDDAFEPRRVVESIAAARRQGADFTPALVEGPIRPDEKVGGYDGKVVALVSPACMSACDRLAAMLKATGRATLVGEPTEGAGGSQQEARNLGARWTDPEGLLSLSIPNAAMGVVPAAGAPAGPEAGDFFRALAFENHPVEPDVRYATRLEDLQGHNQGWLGEVDRALFGPAPSRRAGADP